MKKIQERKFKAPYVPRESEFGQEIALDVECQKQLLEQDDIPDAIKALIDQQQHRFASFGKNIDLK